MSRKWDQELETQIASRVIERLLEIGPVTVNNDTFGHGDNVVIQSRKGEDILAAMFSTDGDMLLVRMPSKHLAYVQFIWGNIQDCIHDYTLDLEEALKPVLEFCNTWD